MKRVWLASMAILLLALAGCNQQPVQSNLGTPFIGGTTGLAVSFPQGMPPLEIFDAGQSVFSVGVQLENVGESGVGVDTLNPYGYVEIIGINPAQFGLSPGQLRKTFSEAQLSLTPARRGYDGTIIPGDIGFVEFNELTYAPDRFGNDEVTIRANICYEYRTYSDTEICFKDNLIENAIDDSICTLAGPKPVSTSAGPVQVTSVTQNPAGADRIQVTFTIENMGNGLVFLPWNYQTNTLGNYGDDACVYSVGANMNRDAVFLEVNLGSSFGATDIRCPILGGSNQGIIRMYGGAPATVTCTIDTLGNQGTRIFTDSLNVDVWYTYLQFLETPLLVRDSNVGYAERGVRQ